MNQALIAGLSEYISKNDDNGNDPTSDCDQSKSSFLYAVSERSSWQGANPPAKSDPINEILTATIHQVGRHHRRLRTQGSRAVFAAQESLVTDGTNWRGKKHFPATSALGQYAPPGQLSRLTLSS